MPDDIFSNPPRGCKTIDLRSGRVIADGGTMPTKQEGPAQEPQRDSCVHCGLRIYQMSDGMFAGQWAHHGSNYRHCHSTNRAEDVATPAPSPPAGAREWLLAREYEMFLSSHVGMSGKLLCDTLELYARQQTAAKDAELKLVSAELYKTKIAHSEANARWMAAERERDSLREENERLRENWKIKAQQFMDDIKRMVEVHEAENAALKARKE